jgi:hypothetical protein
MAVQKERRAAPRKAAAKAESKDKPKSTPADSPAKAKPAGSAFRPPSDAEIRRLVAEAAYFRAKARGFAPGYEVEDWVQAETEIKRRMDGA